MTDTAFFQFEVEWRVSQQGENYCVTDTLLVQFISKLHYFW